MIVVDANLLIYAYDSTCPEHTKARRWMEDLFNSPEMIGIPWQNISAFIRILTFHGIHGARFAPDRVLAIVDQWIEMPRVRLLAPLPGHWAHLREMLVRGDARGRVASDAVLAALTIEHGGVLHTADRDFARFPGLRWRNPLLAS